MALAAFTSTSGSAIVLKARRRLRKGKSLGSGRLALERTEDDDEEEGGETVLYVCLTALSCSSGRSFVLIGKLAIKLTGGVVSFISSWIRSALM